jgi:hypothetical protein
MTNTEHLGNALARTVHDLWPVHCPQTKSAVVDLDDVLNDVRSPQELERFMRHVDRCLDTSADPTARTLMEPLLRRIGHLKESQMRELRAIYREARQQLQHTSVLSN